MTFILKSQPRRTEHRRPGSRSRRSGFTLLELIGVMVVIAILAAAVLPSTIDLIQVQRSVNEGAELPKIAEALKRGILREQRFPEDQNAATAATDDDAAFWWNLAARHGGGSANTVRYPLGVRPGSDNTRKLYFAEPAWAAAWAGRTFFEVTGDGAGWLLDPQDPSELRLLLVSTSSSDLPLPDSLSTTQFDAFWDDWAIGNDGDPATPATGAWANYGLSAAAWSGRAPELNVQRIDLRDWVSTVVIENRRAILEASGENFGNLSGDWARGSVYAYTENVVGAEVILQTSDVSDGNDPPSIITRVEGVVLTKRGRVTDESNGVNIVIGGSKVTTAPGPPIVTTSTPTQVPIPLALTPRAPIALLNPNYDPNDASGGVRFAPLNGWDISDAYKQTRYFLPRQELLLGEPWEAPDKPDEYPEVGIFTIDKPFSTLRFDGLQWQY